MKYDFTSILQRQGMDAIAVDALGAPGVPGKPAEGFDAIPMWVADMNFPVVPTIQQSIGERLAHPAFGYFGIRQEYYEAIIRWQSQNNGVTGLTQEAIGYENGVLGGVLSAIRALAAPGEEILVHSPTYIGFTNAIGGSGYRLVHSPLKKDAEGTWRMDFADMEEKLAKHSIHTAVFCSPHNPCGRVWERWEIEQAMALFKKYNVYVISDEIWSDLILEGHQHIPTQSVSEDARMRTAAFYAPSKTFNLAGLVGSYHIIYNPWLRDRTNKESAVTHYNSMNVLSMYALIGAYREEGYEWLKELRQVLTRNVEYACTFIKTQLDGVEVSQPQGTYMLFADCRKWCEKHHKTMDELEKACWDVGVALQDGRAFHGEYCLRINLALPLSRVQEAFDRLKKYVFQEDIG